MSDIYTIAKSGLKAYKEGLATTGQNIANVGNEAYSRREASISEVKSGSPDVLQLSENMSFGVKVDGITRAFDQFIDVQLQNAKSNFSFSQAQTQVFNQLENIVRPETGSVSQRINEFFAALSNVAQDPSDLAARYGAVDAAKAISHSFKLVAQGINDLKSFVGENLIANAADANSYIKQLSNIQKELLGNTNSSNVRNDLLDQRDRLLGELSEIVEIKVHYKNHGEIEILAGTEGQGQLILHGFETKKLSVANIDGSNKIFIGPPDVNSGTMVQISSGKIAGHLSSEYALGQTKAALDALARKFVTEINDVHQSGVDLDGNIGERFFSLNATTIQKNSQFASNAQIQVSGIAEAYLNSTLTVAYVAENDFWQIKDDDGVKLSQFKGSTNLGGTNISVSGTPSIGDSFEVTFSDTRAENISVNIKDAKQLAASAFYLVSPKLNNSGNIKVTAEINPIDTGIELASLNELLVGANNSANPISFRKNGVLGLLQNVDKLDELTALKQQAKLQLAVPISNLSSSSELKVTLGATEHTFILGAQADTIKNYTDLANLLNTGILRTENIGNGNLTFSDLGLRAGGNLTTLVISSAFMGNADNFKELQSGELAGVTGKLIAGSLDPTGLQVFTKEGVHLAGSLLNKLQIQSLITKENGFSQNAQYDASHIANSDQSEYIGAQIKRITTAGYHVASISSLAKSSQSDSNLNIGDMENIPLSRSKMTAPLSIETEFGDTIVYESSQGMMAGSIAAELNGEISKFGISASAYNHVELYEIPKKVIAFKLQGDNSEPLAISADLTTGNLQILIDNINAVAARTGITASRSSSSGLVLVKNDGNDINIQNVAVPDGGNIKVRQLDQYGEIIKSPENNNSPTISSGKYAIFGGQIELRSPSEFKLSISGAETTSQTEEFANGFISRTYKPETSATGYEFQTLKSTDQAMTGAEGLISVAASSSYEFVIKGDNSTVDIKAKVQGATGERLTKSEVASEMVRQLRGVAPEAIFRGNTFTFSTGFPKNGDTLEFRLGDQIYRATLNDVPKYTASAGNVEIGGVTYNETDALKQLVSASTFFVEGPEEGRLRVGFTEVSGGFQVYAVANDGVISGHALRLSGNNPGSILTAFNIDNSSTALIQGKEFSIPQADNKIIAKLLVGDSITNITYHHGTPPSVSPTTANGIEISLETMDSGGRRLKISIPNSVADQDIRLKATDDSENYGISTASTQITSAKNGFSLSEYGADRVEVNAKVQSLASEMISMHGLSGEDLIVIATGNTRPSILGSVTSATQNLDAREITAKVSTEDGKKITLIDTKSGDYLGVRELNSMNEFNFRNLNWKFDGLANKDDEFTLVTSGNRQDDASNLVRFNALASLSETSGKGGYSEIYANLVTETGFKSREAEQRFETTEAIHNVALDRKSEFSGVDLDTEAARLLEQQQAYQALAKVLSTAKELVDTLLRSF
jgi:flagellar hook-associated protein 1 FlgK